MLKEIHEFSLSNGARENWYNNIDIWRCLSDIVREHLNINSNRDYTILFTNITNGSKFPDVFKFVVFDWKNIKLLVYREPQVKVLTFPNYNECLDLLKKCESKLLEEGLTIQNQEEYKRVFLFKDIDKHEIKEIQKGDQIIKLGDFLSTCWGYDQTNVELFIVKKIIGKNYLIIQEIAQEIATESSSVTYDNVRVSKSLLKIDIPIKAYISNDGYMSVCEYGYKRGLSLTDMNKEHYKTNPQFGH